MKDPLKRGILQTIGGHIDEVSLVNDPNSFVEMDQGVVHVASDRFGERYFRVVLEEVTAKEYRDSIHIDPTTGEPYPP